MSVENTHYGAARIGEMLRDCKSIYFIGIGGINMSSLAHLSMKKGYRVGGSDRATTELCRRLEASGIVVNYCHDKKNAEGYDAFVYTVAIGEDNPEYVYAKENGLPLISRADYLGYIMTDYSVRVGVSGMHGKSTCTSMCAEILIGCDSSPTVLSGAELPCMSGAYCVGESENFVFEACEYMDSFLDFNPTIAVILNIEMDHVDYFHSMEQIRESFGKYAAITGKDGYAVYNADDTEVIRALEGYEGNRISFGRSEGANVRAVNICNEGGCYAFDIVFYGEYFCHVRMRVSGHHNIYNALAATAVCHLCGVSAEDIAAGLGSFCGACRRMEYKGSVRRAHVYDDYAHHPTEISATLKGAKEMAEGKLVVVYQPHTYSRTAALFDEFAAAFDSCDEVIFADIYAAREVNSFGVNTRQLAEKIGDKARYGGDFESCARMLADTLREGDVGIVMGAGDVYKVFDYLDFEV